MSCPRARRSRRDGFTLMELMLGLVLLGLLGGAVTVVITTAARVAGRASQHLAAGRTVQALRGFLQQELRDAVDGDVSSITPARIGLSRQVGEAPICASADSAVVVASAAWAGTRLPEAGRDGALLLTDPVAATWQYGTVDSIGPDSCPDGTAAMRLRITAEISGASVLRVIEPVQLSAYPSGAADWFGLTPADGSAVVQPFAGPLASGGTRWQLFPGMLTTTLQPAGGSAMTFSTPLGTLP